MLTIIIIIFNFIIIIVELKSVNFMLEINWLLSSWEEWALKLFFKLIN